LENTAIGKEKDSILEELGRLHTERQELYNYLDLLHQEKKELSDRKRSENIEMKSIFEEKPFSQDPSNIYSNNQEEEFIKRLNYEFNQTEEKIQFNSTGISKIDHELKKTSISNQYRNFMIEEKKVLEEENRNLEDKRKKIVEDLQNFGNMISILKNEKFNKKRTFLDENIPNKKPKSENIPQKKNEKAKSGKKSQKNNESEQIMENLIEEDEDWPEENETPII